MIVLLTTLKLPMTNPRMSIFWPRISGAVTPLVKTGGRLVKHARYYWLLLAEGHLTRRRFGAMLGRIALLRIPTG